MAKKQQEKRKKSALAQATVKMIGDSEVKKVISISDASFEPLVLKSELPVVVDFWASWCVPCTIVSPIVDELAEEFGERVKFCKLNTEENRIIPEKFGIRSIPTIIFFKDGVAFDVVIGVRNKEYYKKIIEKMLKPKKESFFRRLFGK